MSLEVEASSTSSHSSESDCDSSQGRGGDDDDGNTTPVRKKQKRLVRYKHEWEGEFTWLVNNSADRYKGCCNLCRKTFSIAHGGRSDVVHHSNSKGHKKAESAAKTRAINDFFVRSTQRSTVDQKVSLFTVYLVN